MKKALVIPAPGQAAAASQWEMSETDKFGANLRGPEEGTQLNRQFSNSMCS